MSNSTNQNKKLKSVFQESCDRHGVPEPQQEALIQSGIGHFEMGTFGDIFPRGNDYQTISQYV